MKAYGEWLYRSTFSWPGHYLPNSVILIIFSKFFILLENNTHKQRKHLIDKRHSPPPPKKRMAETCRTHWDMETAFRIVVGKSRRKTILFLDVMPCRLVYMYQRFEGTYCLLFQDRKLWNIGKYTPDYMGLMPQDNNLHSHSRGNLKTH
jgi:hypothetical protein